MRIEQSVENLRNNIAKGSGFRKKQSKEILTKQCFFVFMYHVSRESWKWLIEIDVLALYTVKLSQSNMRLYVIFTQKNHLISSLKLLSSY